MAYVGWWVEQLLSLYTDSIHLAMIEWSVQLHAISSFQIWGLKWWSVLSCLQHQWLHAEQNFGTVNVAHRERQLYLQMRRNAQQDHNFPVWPDANASGSGEDVETMLVPFVDFPISQPTPSRARKKRLYAELSIAEMEVP